MAAADKTQCTTCGKEKATSRCIGCLEDFCFNHLSEHRQQLNQQLDDIEVSRDLFLQTLTQHINAPYNHPLIQEINQWEQKSIEIIQKTAEETRKILLIHIPQHIHQIEQKLNELTNQLRQNREENNIIEIDLQKWSIELEQMTEQLNKPSNITIQQSSTPPLINTIQVEFSALKSIRNISTNVKWMQNGITVAGGKGQGNGLNQLNQPCGICIDDETIYIADSDNYRIVKWEKSATNGQVVAGGNGYGNRNNQLYRPVNVVVDKKNDCLIICDRDNKRIVRWSLQNGISGETIISDIDCWGLAMDHDGYIYVSNPSQHEVRRWKIGETQGIIVAGGNQIGKRLDQLNRPMDIFVDQDQSIYISDYYNHRVMKWIKGARQGIVVAGGNGEGNNLKQLYSPYGIIVDQLGTVYVVDCNNNRVMRWFKGATQGTIVVGGNERGQQPNQFHVPLSLSFDQQNNLYVVDTGNQRIQKFNIELFI